MPATGNNISLAISTKSVSIRLWSGGLSFFYMDGERSVEGTQFFQADNFTAHSVAAALKNLPPHTTERVAVYVDTSEVLFVPEEVLADGLHAELLRQAGIKIPVHHNIITTESVDGICGLYTLPAEIQHVVETHWQGTPVRWYSPLHELLAAGRQAAIITETVSDDAPETANATIYLLYATLENMYVIGCDERGRTMLCESYPCRSEAEAVYLLSCLTGPANRRKIRLYIYGDRPVRYTKVLKRYYPHTKSI